MICCRPCVSLLTRLSAAAGTLFLSTVTFAGTIRDDRDPALYTTLGANPIYDCVGMVQVDEDGTGEPAIGSGTLVAPNWMLTAAHVVEGSPRGISFVVGGQTISATRWISCSKYKGNLIKGYDVALVELSTPVTNVTPAKVYSGHHEFGQVGTFVGFGRTGNGVTGDTADDRVRRAGTNVIDGYISNDSKGRVKLSQSLKRDKRTFGVDFDSPSNPSLNRLGSATPTDMEYLISRGDSGGPAFIDDPDHNLGPVIAGIHSYGEYFDELDDSSYGDVVGETRVSKYASWINKIITSEKYQKQQRKHFVTPALAPSDAFSLDPTARMLLSPAYGPQLESPLLSNPASSLAPVPEPAFAGMAGLLALGGLLCRTGRKPRQLSAGRM